MYSKLIFRSYIRRYTSSNENFEYDYPHSNALLQFRLELERWKPHKAARHPTRCDIINDVKQCSTVYRRIYCRRFLTLSCQPSRYKIRCIRILFDARIVCGVFVFDLGFRIMRRYTSPNENLNMVIPILISNALLQSRLKLERWKPHKAARHPTRCDIINDVKQCSTVHRRLYCRKFLTLSSQTSRYKIRCIRILFDARIVCRVFVFDLGFRIMLCFAASRPG